jgi:hypothetical protein
MYSKYKVAKVAEELEIVHIDLTNTETSEAWKWTLPGKTEIE